MAHLSTQLQERFLARALSPRETVAAAEHLRECESCRQSLMALRSRKPGSLVEQILPGTQPEEHSSADLLAAYVDNDLSSNDRALLEKHLSDCRFCQETLADLRSFRGELQRLPSKEYAPGDEVPGWVRRSEEPRASDSSFWIGLLHWLMQPAAFGGAIAAAAVVVVLGVITARFSGNSVSAGPPIVDTIRDGLVTLRVQADGHLTLSSGQLSSEAITELSNSIVDLARSELPFAGVMRGLSNAPGASEKGSPEEVKPSGNGDYFTRMIFGMAVVLPRETADPDAKPNGIVIRDGNPVLNWSPPSAVPSALTLTVTECATGAHVVKKEIPGNASSFQVQPGLEHGKVYLWAVTTPDQSGSSQIVASGRFKVASEKDLQAIASPAAESSQLLKAFMLARAGLLSESETELVKLQSSNQTSPTVSNALRYVQQLEGK